MNERIKELERKCWDYQTNHLNAEKFAELIVRECCDVLHDNEMGGYRVNYVLKEQIGRAHV
mgnify:CR=1 FL=1